MLGAIGGLANTFLGMQMYGLQKDKLAEAKRQYNQDYQINKQLTNSRLEDRQRARVASNAGAYQSVGDYMNQYGVKG
jgi:membrane protease subunit (stomatin/prohibitin family)